MQFLRKLALVLAASLFMFLLFGFGTLWGFQQVFGSSDSIKTAFRDSGIYNSVVSDALKQAQKEEEKHGTPSETNIPISDPQIRAIISQAFPPSFMQTQTENLLDSTYSWLQGKTPTLEFTMNLSAAKTRLADGVANYARQRLSTLPACTANDLRTPPGDLDPFNAPCLPPGADVNAVAERPRQEILAGEFMKDTVITAADLKSKEGKPFSEEYKNAPKAFTNAVNGIYFMGFLAALLGVAIVFLSSSRRAGLRKVGILSLIVGVLILLFSWMLGFVLGRATTELAKTPEGQEPLQQKLMQILQSLSGDLRGWWLWFGLVVVALAVGGLIALRFTKQQENPAAPADTPPAPGPAGQVTSTVEQAEHSTPSKPATHKHKKHH